MSDMKPGDAMLVQFLAEAHAKEAELEGDLTAHIAMTTKDSYRKRLQEHLKETRRHKKMVEQRIKKLGGDPPGGGIVAVPGEVAGKAVAAVKGQVGTVRAALTGETEMLMRNAQEELREENVEIAFYTRIATFADGIGDKETARLAREILRDEQRMAKFLEAELERLVKRLVIENVPPADRAPQGRKARSGARKPAGPGTSTAGKPAAPKKRAGSGKKAPKRAKPAA
jgi:ferritin-like metal-binding protein YciE